MKIRKILKKIIPKRIVYRIKMGSEMLSFSFKIKMIEENPSGKDYILGTPIHSNLGDHLITLAEFDFLRKINQNRDVIEIPTEMYQIYRDRLKKAIPSDSMIYINGGGWMGNIWPVEELLLQDMINLFSDNKVIVFPQTIYFKNDTVPYHQLINSANNIFAKCRDVTLCVRDRQSYEFAINNYKDIKVLLVPDIALTYQKETPKNKGIKYVVGYCLREDRELSRNREQESLVRRVLHKYGYTEKSISTMSKRRVPTWKREAEVNKGLEAFASCTIVVTDRLHGMIFSYITNTPCIVFDNKTKKVSGVFTEWLKNSTHILPLFGSAGLEEINSFILACTNKPCNNDIFFENRYDELKEMIVYGQDQ